MAKVRILKEGLIADGRVRKAGEIIDEPGARLMELAQPGAKLRGENVAEVVKDPPKSKVPEPESASGKDAKK